ncbi:MAG: GNAT family N-acetyltransferase [Pseudomonadota bacterium]
MVEIRERTFDDFFEVPFAAYPSSEPYVSPMRSDLKRMLSSGVNPLFPSDENFTYFTAIRNGRPTGRIVVHNHAASNALYKTNQASFGFFDCEDNGEVAGALLEAASQWARARGFDMLCGNFNLTAMQQCGVQTDGFNRQGFTDMVQNPAHIPRLLEANGFEAYFPMTTFALDLASAMPTGKTLPSDASYSFAPIEKKSFPARMEDARLVLNDGFADNPMFVALSNEDFVFQAGEMMTILDPRLSSVLLCDNEPVGVVICIPDLNGFLRSTKSRFGLLTPFHFLRYRLNRKRAVIIFYSVARKCHGLGIMGAMLDHTLQALRNAGYRELGLTWIADINAASLRQAEKLGAKPLHRLHLFKKAL